MHATDVVGELLAPYECSICGDEHGESAHGEPLILRDLGRDTIRGNVDTFIADALALVDGVPATGDITYAGRVYRLMNEWNAQTPDEQDEYASEYLDDIDAILTDAGFHAITDADQGTWSVYSPVAESVTS